jgi:hypothetical protein
MAFVHTEETLGAATARYERKGFTGQFGALPGGRVQCFTCQHASEAGDVAMLALHRLEGASDPGEEMAVAAVECPVCDARGTLTLVYGPMAPPEDSMVLARLADERGATGIASGL